MAAYPIDPLGELLLYSHQGIICPADVLYSLFRLQSQLEVRPILNVDELGIRILIFNGF